MFELQLLVEVKKYAYFIVFSRHRSAMICTPHKIATQTWRHFFLNLNEKDDPSNPKGYMLHPSDTPDTYKHFEHKLIQTRWAKIENNTYFGHKGFRVQK